jgi:hypothetical protein
MKSGAGDEPIDTEALTADEEQESNTQPGDDGDTADTPPETRPDEQPESTDSSDIMEQITADDMPYLITRSRVKDNRAMVSYFLRPETREQVEEAHEAVEQELGNDVQTLDLREALVLVGLDNIEEVADTLRDFGYRLKK